MPNKCCVAGCKGNYNLENHVHVFAFPKDEELRRKWLLAINRNDLVLSKNSRVCEHHFNKDSIIWNSTYVDGKTGKILQAPLKYPKLKHGSLPKIVLKCSKSDNVSRDDNFLLGQEVQAMANRKSLFEHFDEFTTIFPTWILPDDWQKAVNEQDEVVLFKMSLSPVPIVTYSVIVHSDLQLETYLYGQAISVQANELKTPCSLNNMHHLMDLLEAIDSLTVFEDKDSPVQDNAKTNKDKIISQACHLLDSVKCDGNNKCVTFICDQLKLLTMCEEDYRYSPDSIKLCATLNTISSHAYEYLRRCSGLILPPQSTLKTVCSFVKDPTAEELGSFLIYAKNVFKYVEADNEHMILLVDEIEIKPFITFTFTLTGVCSNFKEVVLISLVSKIDPEILFKFIKSVITGLEQIGYKIFCIVTDSSAVTTKAMCNFSGKKQQSIVYPHPAACGSPLFHLFDSVHLLKSIKNSWMNEPDKILSYPDFETSDLIKCASFQSLIRLYNTENDSLTSKSLFPSNVDKQNVQLALTIFNPSVVEALLRFGTKISHGQETACFLDIISTWWRIMNVSAPCKDINDVYRQPVTNSDDPKLTFLQNMLNWLEIWKTSPKLPKKLSTQTHTALHHTIYGTLEVVKYCFEELNMSNVLLGKFQADPLEKRFEKYQSRCIYLTPCGQYNISARQLYEGKKILRIQSLMSLKSTCFGSVAINGFYEDEDNSQESTTSTSDWFKIDINISEKDIESVKEEMSVIAYLGGYCCHVVLKKIKCDECKNNLTFPDNIVLDRNILTKYVCRLKFPKDEVTNIVLIVYLILNKILQRNEDQFLRISNRILFLSTFTLDYIRNNNTLLYFPHCNIHNAETIVEIVIKTVANTLLKNYCKKNDRVGKGSKRKLDTSTA